MSSSQYHPADCTPTVRPAEPFDAAKDAEILHDAMKGVGTNEEAIIEILAHRSITQRLEIAKIYETIYCKDLIEKLKSELTGKFEDVIMAMMTPLPEFYAKELHDAITGIGTNEEAIIEILCTLSSHGIETTAKIYEELYGVSLVSDLKGDTSGSFKHLCVSLVENVRAEDSVINKDEVKADAVTLGVSSRWVSDDYVFHDILTTKSYHHLRAVFEAYEKLTKVPIERTIDVEFFGNNRKCLKAIVRCIQSKSKYFVKRLHKSMKGLGTKDKTLIRIIVSRSEIDLGDIKKAFQEKYGKSMESWIKGDTSGDYKRILLALCGNI